MILKRKRDYVGRKVRTCVPLTSGVMSIPVGTLMIVVGIGRGADLKGSPCPHCGVVPRITKVPYADFELVE